MISQSELKEILRFNPDSGEFTWLHRRGDNPGLKQWNGKWAGKVAGYKRVNKNGKSYIVININRKIRRAHRLAFVFMNGSIPDDMEVDHINGDGIDNRWVNLRLVDRSGNSRNHRKRSTNTSGFTGVSWNKAIGRWVARIGVDGRAVSLGYFSKIEDAIKARKLANEKHGYHENHGKDRPL